MNKTIIYVLTSDGNDVYEAMTYFSVLSLKLTNKDSVVKLYVDSATNKKLNKSSKLVSIVDDIIEVYTPDGTNLFRNRYIKTQLGSLVAEKFLFLDSDTIVRKSLDSIFLKSSDIAGANNNSRTDFIHQVWSKDRVIIDEMKWRLGKQYINGGVLYYNHTPGSIRFSLLWHEYWKKCISQTASFRDQPSLNAALYDCGADLGILTDEFNAQIDVQPSVAENAAIWHYYFSTNRIKKYWIDCFLERYIGNNTFSLDHFKRMLKSNNPYRGTHYLGKWVAKLVIRQNKIYKWQQYILRAGSLKDLYKMISKRLLPFKHT